MVHFETYTQCKLVSEAGLTGEGGISLTEGEDQLAVGMAKAENATVLRSDRLSGSTSVNLSRRLY